VKCSAKTLFLFALVLLAPGQLFACATCYGAVDSPMTEGMNFGIMTLLAFIGTVLMCALGLLIYFIRKSESLAAAAEKSNPSPKV
jgi:heme/copper-type cytochrome/quinol oxidase subunit 2